jgi:hypothetical protein
MIRVPLVISGCKIKDLAAPSTSHFAHLTMIFFSYCAGWIKAKQLPHSWYRQQMNGLPFFWWDFFLLPHLLHFNSV